MSLRPRGPLSALVTAAILGPLALGQSTDLRDSEQIAGRISQELDLDVWSLQDLRFDIPPDGGFDVDVRLAGADFRLEFHPTTMRAPDFKVVEIDENGQEVEVQPPAPATYKGEVFDPESDFPVGTCVGSSWDGQLRARVRFTDHSDVWGIQHLSDAMKDYAGATHVVYHSLDIVSPDVRCGADDIQQWRDESGDMGSGGPADTGDQICEIAIDCDKPYYDWAGGTYGKCVRNAEAIMLEVEELYESSSNALDITYELTYIVVRKNGDPYSSTNPGTLLDQFRSHWNSRHQNARRDVAHLMTGRNLDGSVIGVAWLSVICDSIVDGRGYGLSQTTFTTNTVSRAGLSAHELGHNWSSNHCDGDSDCGIMCSGLGGCSGNLTRFGNSAQSSIRNHRNSRSCLDTEMGPPVMPFFEDFETGDEDPDNWSWWIRTRVGQGGVNEVSGVYSLRLNATGSAQRDQDEIRSHHLDLSGDSTGTLCLWVEVRGAEAGEFLRVEYYTKGKQWKRIGTVDSTGVKENNYTQYCFNLKPNCFHRRFRVRLRPRADETNDNFWVDDVSVTSSTYMSDGGPGGPQAGGDHGSRRLKVIGAPPRGRIVLYAGAQGLHPRPFDPRRGSLDLVGNAYRIGQVQTDHNGYAEIDVKLPPTLEGLNTDLYVQGLVLAAEVVETTTPVAIRR